MAADGLWDFAGEDTQYGTHGIHTYVAAMVPALARRLIDAYVPAGGTVLDPFCGGGAVLVEALRSGRKAIGRDINPLAALVSQGKTTHIDAGEIRETGAAVLARARGYAGEPLRFPKSDYVEFWFKEYMLRPLTGLRYAINILPDARRRTLFQVLYSATVRSVSLTHRNEVRLRRLPPEQEAAFNPEVLGVFGKYLDLAVERVPELPPGPWAEVRPGDARHLEYVANNAAAAVVCSPPYGDERNGVSYSQFAKNMLRWLGYSAKDIRQAKGNTLGWGQGQRAVPPSPCLFDALNRLADRPKAAQEAVAFYADYYDALREMARVARQRIIIVIGNRVLNKQTLDNAQITVELLDTLGVPLEERHDRSLPTKRLPRMREAGAAIDREAVLVFRK